MKIILLNTTFISMKSMFLVVIQEIGQKCFKKLKIYFKLQKSIKSA